MPNTLVTPTTKKAEVLSPVAPAVVLTESGTHVAFGISIGNQRKERRTGSLPQNLLRLLKRACCCSVISFYPSYSFLKLVKATGAHVLWRVKSDFGLEPEEMLPDGSYLSRLYEYRVSSNSRGGHRTGKSIPVRVVKYKLKGLQSQDSYRVITTILDPKIASAQELGAHYHERWEVGKY